MATLTRVFLLSLLASLAACAAQPSDWRPASETAQPRAATHVDEPASVRGRWVEQQASSLLPPEPSRPVVRRSQPLTDTGNLASGVAVLAVAAADDRAGINRNLLAIELAELIRQRHALPVLSTARVREAIGNQAHASMQQHLALAGQLAHRDRQRLMAARLPVPVALTLRVTDNRVVPGRTEIQPLRDDRGRAVPGAERVVLSTVRYARVRVEMLDLRTGVVYWQRDYEAAPAYRRGYNRFRGSTLGQSLAAELATRLANGLGEPDAPPPPSLQMTLRALLVEVVDQLPLVPAPG